MKAFIFNSGTGSRMGELTLTRPKALIELTNGETILGRQIRLLKNAGIRDIIISTGPFEEQIFELTKNYSQLTFRFVNNDIYKDTNNIYSLFLAEKYIDDDFIVMHGDLVFDSLLLDELINHNDVDVCLINTLAKQPEKDFKGRIIDGKLEEISVSIFDENCFALQPLYKFSKKTMMEWLMEIRSFVKSGQVTVYAETALNEILYRLDISFLDYKSHYIEEIDNKEDLLRVSSEFRNHDYNNQTIVISEDYINEINKYIHKHKIYKPFIVHGKHLLGSSEFDFFIKGNEYITFADYSSNPTYDQVISGLNIFRNNNCDAILAIGGGSCIDVAKAIKLYSIFEGDYINQKPLYVDIPMLAIPTTAGTGSESTRYAVIYYNGEKQSLVQDSLLPDTCILNKRFLYDLPEYHKISSFLDAFCQAIESYWSINSNAISKDYSKQALKLILDNYQGYFQNEKNTYDYIMYASNLAGKAINITQTTAPHAMSYKLTTLTGIAHGHAVSLMLPQVLSFMIENLDLSQDTRGRDYLDTMFTELAGIFDTDTHKEMLSKISLIISNFKLGKPIVNDLTLKKLSKSVNKARLENNPVKIDEQAALNIYRAALS